MTNQKLTYPRWQIAVWLLTSVSLLAFTAYKAVTLSMTHDEVNLYFYAQKSLIDILIINPPYPANHILLTLQISLTTALFGMQEWAIRLPVMVAHLLFLIFTFRLVRLTDAHPFLQICGWLFLNCNPYFLDFFSLARGYAPAATYMLISVYYFLKYLQQNFSKNKPLIWAFIWGAAAAYTNFTLLNYYAALAGTFGFFYILTRWQKSIYIPNRHLYSALIISVLLAAICSIPLYRLMDTDQFYFARDNGFWRDTVFSLIKSYIYRPGYGSDLPEGIEWFVRLVMLGSLLTAIINLKNWLSPAARPLHNNQMLQIAIFTLLILAVLSPIVQFYLLGTKYLFERLGVFYYPLFFTNLYFTLALLRRPRFLSYFLFIFIAVWSVFHQVNSANLDKSRDWYYDADSKDVVLFLKNHYQQQTPKETVNLYVTWNFVPAFDFYIRQQKLDWLHLVNRVSPRNVVTEFEDIDLIYQEKKILSEENKKLDLLQWRSFEKGNNVLYHFN